MLVRLRKSFRTRGHSLNPKTFAFFFAEFEHDELNALRGRQTDMFFCSSVCCLFFLSSVPRICWGTEGGQKCWKAGEKAWFESLASSKQVCIFASANVWKEV
jgi:hypothetical protein